MLDPVIRNSHQRLIKADISLVGPLLDRLGTDGDPVWPGWPEGGWPPMCFDGSLAVGTTGGHWPILYQVVTYVPSSTVAFRLTAPRGISGQHSFELQSTKEGETLVTHTISARLYGRLRWQYPLILEPLHDAAIEDLFDRLELAIGWRPRPRQWSARVRLIRWFTQIEKSCDVTLERPPLWPRFLRWAFQVESLR